MPPPKSAHHGYKANGNSRCVNPILTSSHNTSMIIGTQVDICSGMMWVDPVADGDLFVCQKGEAKRTQH